MICGELIAETHQCNDSHRTTCVIAKSSFPTGIPHNIQFAGGNRNDTKEIIVGGLLIFIEIGLLCS